MRTNFILAFMLAGAVTLTSCTHKADEKTMADINQFGNDWMALGEKANNWANGFTQATQQTKDFCTKQTTMMNNMANSKDETMKMKCSEMVKTCNENATKMDGMMAEWTSFKTSWDENTKSFSDWKDKVMKGEVSQDDAMKGLNDWKGKMTDAQTKIEGWNTMMASINESNNKCMAMAEEMEKSSTPTTNNNMTNNTGNNTGKKMIGNKTGKKK